VSHKVSAKYSGDQIEVWFSGDYGHDDDSGMTDVENVAIDRVDVLGCDLNIWTLSKDLLSAIMGLSDNLDWSE
jgi:hypothetical protein